MFQFSTNLSKIGFENEVWGEFWTSLYNRPLVQSSSIEDWGYLADYYGNILEVVEDHDLQEAKKMGYEQSLQKALRLKTAHLTLTRDQAIQFGQNEAWYETATVASISNREWWLKTCFEVQHYSDISRITFKVEAEHSKNKK
jgi:hypothetical protein